MTDETDTTSTAFVLLSGGIDSAVCLQRALHDHDQVEAIHIDYGQQTEAIERANAGVRKFREDLAAEQRFNQELGAIINTLRNIY